MDENISVSLRADIRSAIKRLQSEIRWKMKNKHLKHYFVAVQHPEASGFEMLDMLMVRDKLASQFESLDAEEQQQLATADQQLILHANAFCAELAQVTDLTYERENRKPTPEQWWWFLDVLVTMPISPSALTISVMPA
ncbi:hypothetical protein KFU94_55890 [Chloroflexi bacterium TSY]|nr:hypothetical protein [Chloroflexi bacterium TSY]